MNFITAHDGFTLQDWVSYDQKHNEANGEDNRDGSDDNASNNWGVEGPTDDAAISATRERVKRAMLATLLFSHGTPMLLGGDEFGRTQQRQQQCLLPGLDAVLVRLGAGAVAAGTRAAGIRGAPAASAARALHACAAATFSTGCSSRCRRCATSNGSTRTATSCAPRTGSTRKGGCCACAGRCDWMTARVEVSLLLINNTARAAQLSAAAAGVPLDLAGSIPRDRAPWSANSSSRSRRSAEHSVQLLSTLTKAASEEGVKHPATDSAMQPQHALRPKSAPTSA